MGKKSVRPHMGLSRGARKGQLKEIIEMHKSGGDYLVSFSRLTGDDCDILEELGCVFLKQEDPTRTDYVVELP